MATQNAAERIQGDTTELSGELSVAVQESDTSGNIQDLIVTNMNQGNTVAGQLIQKLIDQVGTLTSQVQQLSQSTNDISSTITSLKKELDDNHSAIQVDQQAIKEAVDKFQETLDKFKFDYKTEKKELTDDIYRRIDSFEIDVNADKTCQLEVNEDLEKRIKVLTEQNQAMNGRVDLLESELATLKENQAMNGRVDLLESELATLKENQAMNGRVDLLESKLTTSMELAEPKAKEKVAEDQTTVNDSQVVMRVGSSMDDLTIKMADLTSKLNDFADFLIPKEVTERRKSIVESHATETRKTYTKMGRPLSFAASSSIDSQTDSSPVLQRSHSTSSSSGRGTLSHKDSGPLFNIDESSLDTSFTGKDITSTPHPQYKARSLSHDEHNSVEVIWAMADLLEALKKLTTNDN